MNIKLKLTIVTVHLDDFNGLDETRNSLIGVEPHLFQFEWIVIDGNSKIKTLQNSEIRKKTIQQANVFISEADNGIYDAMNKGTKLATGDYLLFLNAGDLIHPNLDWSLLSTAMENDPDMIWGQCVEEYPTGELVRVKTRTPRWAWYSMPVNHPATIYRYDTLPRPAFNLNYKLAADYDLLLKLLTEHSRISFLDSPISIFRHGGLSSSLWDNVLKEDECLRNKYYQIGRLQNMLITAFKRINRKLGKSARVRRVLRSRL